MHFFLVLILTSCQAEVHPVIQTVPSSPTLEPTSIILSLPSVVPTPTSQIIPTPMPTPDPGVDDLPDYYGGLVITLDNVGETLIMRPQGGFLLRLGNEYRWNVTVTPPDVITLNRKAPLEPGEQGVFIARKRGSVLLHAVGEPACLTYDPPCDLPTVLFKMNVLVE